MYNGIQLFQNAQANEIIQMMWNGNIHESEINQAFCELQSLAGSLTQHANLLVIVSDDTQLPETSITLTDHCISRLHFLSGWMVIGGNQQANAVISKWIAQWYSHVAEHKTYG